MATANDVPDVIEPLLDEILHTDTNWFTVEFAPTEKKNKYELKFCAKGKGGLTELRENLSADDRIFYGSLQVDLVDANGSRYDKYVYFKYLPNKANKGKRYLWNFENSIKTSFKFKHVSLEDLDENLTGFDEAGITKEFLRVSENQMEYTSLDFGGNNIYKLKNGKVMPPNMKNVIIDNNNNNNNNGNNDEKEDYPADPPAAAVDDGGMAVNNDNATGYDVGSDADAPDATNEYGNPPADAPDDENYD